MRITDRVQSTTCQQALLVLVATLIFFVNLGGARLWDDDEPKNAQCAREMLARGDWIVPTFNGALRYDKPALLYWLMMPAYRLFGDSEFAARFWSAIAAIGTTLATYHIGRILFHPRIGFWAGWIVASSLMFVVAGRAATPDSLLILCTTLAMLAFVRATWGANTTLAGANRLDDYLPRSATGMAAVYASMAVGVLAKGPVAVVLPTVALVVYLAAVRQALTPAALSTPRRLWRLCSPAGWIAVGWKLRPLTAALVIAAIALPWYVAVGLKTDGDWIAGFFGRHNVGRYLHPMEGHRGPFFYYLPAVLFGFFPWSIFLPQAAVRVCRQMRASGSWAAYLFLTCWTGVWVGFFSFSGTKLPSYVTPVYPALAIMTATWIDAWLTAPQEINRWFLRQSIASVMIVGALIVAALPFIAHYFLPGEATLALIGLTLIIGAVPALAWAVRRPEWAALSLAATSLAFMVALFGFGAVRVSRHQNSAALDEVMRQRGAPPKLAAFELTAPSLAYYARRQVPQLAAADDALRHLLASPEAVLVTYTRGYEALRPRLPNDVAIVARRQRFLRNSEVIVLGRASATARRTAAPKY